MMKLHFYYRGLLWKINLHFLLLPPGRAGTHANMYIYIYICVYTYMYSIYHYKSIHWKPPEIHQPNFFKFIKGSISLWTETRPRTAVKTPMLLAWAQGSWTKTQKYVYICDRYGIWYSAHLYKVATFGNLQPNKKSNNMSPTSIGSQYTLKMHTNVPPLDPLAFKHHHLQ